ncbi:MAG TPA: response regulator transcription factor [Anaerolineae bacterium]|nr:response regulator transcription factor [Anaerolineae bacterium]
MSGMRVLLVEGSRTKTTSLAPAIKKVGFQVAVVHTGKDALLSVAAERPHVVVFETSAMRSSGVRSCFRLRERWPDLPIIHCRAADRVLDTSAAADIYLQRPFTSRKIINRIRKLLPATDHEDQIERVGDITLFHGKRAASVNGRGEFPLTPKLYGLLQEFMAHPNETVTRKHLMQKVWKTDYVGDTRTLDVHIRWLREILEDNPAKPRRLKTRRGKGYVLVVKKELPTG